MPRASFCDDDDDDGFVTSPALCSLDARDNGRLPPPMDGARSCEALALGGSPYPCVCEGPLVLAKSLTRPSKGTKHRDSSGWLDVCGDQFRASISLNTYMMPDL